MTLFQNWSVLLDLKSLPFKERKKLQSAIKENGGCMSYVVNKQCSLVVSSDVASLSSSRFRSVQKLGTPVVGPDYVSQCLEQGVLLPLDMYRLEVPSPGPSYPPPHRISPPPSPPHCTEKEARPLAVQCVDPPPVLKAVHQAEETGQPERDGRFYTEKDSDLPTYPEDFQVAKYSIFKKVTGDAWCVVELQSVRVEGVQRYRVVRSRMESQATGRVIQWLAFPRISTEAVYTYLSLREELQAEGLQPQLLLPVDAPEELGSAALRLLLLEERLNTGSLPQEVGVFVELLWAEALGCLDNVLSVPVTDLSLNDVSRAEGHLLQAQRLLKEGRQADASTALMELYALLPHRETAPPVPTARHLSLKLDLCQLIRDMLNVSEMNLRSPVSLSVGKYRSLRCGIEVVPPETPEFRRVVARLSDKKVKVLQVLRVSRWEDQQMFKKEVGNIKPLLHSSAPSNFMGILSRGLLLPCVGSEDHGIERTDIGNLGSGIYFTDSMRTSLKYSKPSEASGSRLVLVCDVALGRCLEVRKKHLRLTQPPDTYHSLHGLRHTPANHSQFVDDEYVVYSTGQVMLRYVVQFTVEEDRLREFTPSIETSLSPALYDTCQEFHLEVMELESKKNPLDDVRAGLQDASGQQLPLQAVHVKCKLMDLLARVIIFQKYTNQSSVPIEAKYVFPLEERAAVCGFEAFINGKHVVGQVKEKEQARKEYKQAIQQGDGAYLMDQDAPDVFTISVGNLPPGATVLIKVTFVSELIVRDGCVLFSLPGSVAPWQQSAALNQTTQASVEKTCVTNDAASSREFSLQMSVEMPYEILRLQCSTHRVQIKTTACKAVVNVLPGEVVGADGFQLSITLSKLHLPRMWVENHPDKDSQACMLVFYPDFPVGVGGVDEVVLLLDASESMVEDGAVNARRIALEVLKALPPSTRVNVVFFGTEQTELFISAKPLSHVLQPARKFILATPPTGGSTELWRPLRALSLLPPSPGPRNLLLLSDGHIQNPGLCLQLLRDNNQHTRLFTCGLSSTANQHMLRTLAQAGGGAYEMFDTKTEHNWKEKVVSQVKRMGSPGCSSVSVKWQQFNPTAPPPVQAPQQIHSLFNDHHTLVYGFVPHCTQALLHGNLSGMEVVTMVSTSELQKTRGTFLHQLTARAVIRDYENGTLSIGQAEHEGKKAELKSFIVELSKEFSILSQFTSFVAIEKRDPQRPEEPQLTDISKIIAEEDVDFLSYMGWNEAEEAEEEGGEEEDKGLIMEEESGDEEEDQEENDVEDDEEEEEGYGLYGVCCGTEFIDDSFDSPPSSPLALLKQSAAPAPPPPPAPSDFKVCMQRAAPLSALDDGEDYEEEEEGNGLLEYCSAAEYIDDSFYSAQSSHALLQQSAAPQPRPPPAPSDLTDCMRSDAPPPPIFSRAQVIVAPTTERFELRSYVKCSTVPNVWGQSGAPPPTQSQPFTETLLCRVSGASILTQSQLSSITPFGRQSAPPPPIPSQPFSGTDYGRQSAPPPPIPSQPFSETPFGRQSGAPPPTQSQSFTETIRYLLTGVPPPSQSQLFSRTPFGRHSAPPPPIPSQPFSETPFGRQSGAPPPTQSQPLTETLLCRESGAPPPTQSQPLTETLLCRERGAPPPTQSQPFSEIPFGRQSGAPPPTQSQPFSETPVGWQSAPLPPDQYQPFSGTLFGWQSGATPPIPTQPFSGTPFGRQSGATPPIPSQPFSGTPFGWQSATPLIPSQPLSGFVCGRQSAPPPPIPSQPFSSSSLDHGQTMMYDLPPGVPFSSPFSLQRDAPPGLQPQYLSAPPSKRGGQLRAKAAMKVGAPPREGGSSEFCRSLLRRTIEDLETVVPRGVENDVNDEIIRMEPEKSTTKWTNIFQMQCSEGYWECSVALGVLLKMEIKSFANVFLKSKGICSLGVRARADILRLLASLLVLQLMRLEGMAEGRLLRNLFSLDTPPEARSLSSPSTPTLQGPPLLSTPTLQGPPLLSTPTLQGPPLLSTPTLQGPPLLSTPTLQGPPLLSTPTLQGPPLLSTPTLQGPPLLSTPTIQGPPLLSTPTLQGPPHRSTPTLQGPPHRSTPTLQGPPLLSTPSLQGPPLLSTPTLQGPPLWSTPTLQGPPLLSTPTLQGSPLLSTPTLQGPPLLSTPTLQGPPLWSTPTLQGPPLLYTPTLQGPPLLSTQTPAPSPVSVVEFIFLKTTLFKISRQA
ncbi:protein mono-ADP-ribosyltransferase PARP4 isoform X3 [Gadus morhua]|uniref:protein mono-ADP-ribosyltransferase PARP4 isoform X3 n=1 Tax=Gadus morhua TaxID=8049 RepID=UPI0011B47034|nr:protein mono-ADP-ribosyltransferase PARP4 isoform X3 [Gadus morhua]